MGIEPPLRTATGNIVGTQVTALHPSSLHSAPSSPLCSTAARFPPLRHPACLPLQVPPSTSAHAIPSVPRPPCLTFQDRLHRLAWKQGSLSPACQAQWAFRMQASATLRPKPTAKAVGFEPPLRSILHTPAHRACPAYILRIRSSLRRSGSLRGITGVPAQAFSA